MGMHGLRDGANFRLNAGMSYTATIRYEETTEVRVWQFAASMADWLRVNSEREIELGESWEVITLHRIRFGIRGDITLTPLEIKRGNSETLVNIDTERVYRNSAHYVTEHGTGHTVAVYTVQTDGDA